ncbi:class I SAM-dependent methyltransferase [Sediminitomix flava]|nr:class I SAM-dependent methyltransferase [Sediminitomix flava]
MSEELRKKLGIDESKPVDWFEKLYSESSEEGEGVPWANMDTHPLFKSWISENPISGIGKTALVVGCGMGDDAIELENAGFEVTAFDVSQTAIDFCKKRFPNSSVNFVQADLLEGVSEWHHKFDFVLEIFTIQALPPKYEDTLIQNVSDFVAKEGQLLVITEVQEEKRAYENGPPWLLNSDYIQSFEKRGLKQIFNSSNTEAEIGDEIHLTIFQR